MPLDLFSKTPLPDTFSDEIDIIILDLKKSQDKRICLKKVYEILIEKYHGNRINTYTKFLDVFTYNLNTLWNKKGFLHCTNINYVLRILLIKSEFFTENDIHLKWTQIWYFSPHQYVQVKMESGWVNIDIWAHWYGIKFGDYAHWFHLKKHSNWVDW